MQFNEQGLLHVFNLSRKKVKHLRQRQLGGTSGQKGYEYQRRYALLRVAELGFVNPAATISMEALCPVDDVVIEDAGAHEHAQCKISETETWSKNGKKLEKEFCEQLQLFKKSRAPNYRLCLVVADDSQRGHLEATLPSKLAGKTEVVCFPHPDPEHRPWLVPRMATALDRLLPPLLRRASPREQLYKELNHAAGTPWQPQQPVADILVGAAESPDLPVAMPPSLARAWTVPPDAWAQASALLAHVPGLVITVDGGVCCYTCGNESGWIARCDTLRFRRFVHDVIARSPVNMKEFLQVRPV